MLPSIVEELALMHLHPSPLLHARLRKLGNGQTVVMCVLESLKVKGSGVLFQAVRHKHWGS